MTDQNLTPASNPQDAQSVRPNQSPLPSHAPQGQGTPAAVKGNFWRGMYITTNIVLIVGIVLYVTSFVLAQIGLSDFENMLRDLDLDSQDINRVIKKLYLNHLTPYLLIMTAVLAIVLAVSLRFKKNNWFALASGFILPIASARVCAIVFPMRGNIHIYSNHEFTSVSDVLEHVDKLVMPEALQYALIIGYCTTIVVICLMFLLIAIYGLHLLIEKKKSKVAIAIVSIVIGLHSLILISLFVGMALMIYSIADKGKSMFSFFDDRIGALTKTENSEEATDATENESSTTTNTSAFDSAEPSSTTSSPDASSSAAATTSTAPTSSTTSQQGNAAGGNHNWNFGVLKTRLLTESDIARYNSSELRLLRNAIYAMHGYKFKDQTLTDYFSQFSWYTPRYTDVSSQLNETERKNIIFLKSHE